ncbi:m-AAA protease-interacting protein 1, mitochondrial isoform X2 [Scyliorhinus canicula]|uniref:m-AAA protease-interacting protein 1, mitochondrial isoform X2 n=1 Tax=Scyliorhinus canicula TaxID=7830 RepID=UPI0018F2B36C|nr:m-AAA protease-interacting protein 1, mitochondrial isoform X2 [Scyliorhinus canicula]
MALVGRRWSLVLLSLARPHQHPGAVRTAKRCLTPSSQLPALRPLPWARSYSSEREPRQRGKKVVVVGIPNPFTWARTRMYFFLIRAYFDQDFTFDEFSAGAKQALEEVEEKCLALPVNRREALAADLDEIMYSTPGDVGIYYDNQGRKFVSIIMRYWYLTDAELPDETPEGTKVFQVVFGDESSKDSKRLLTANYEFRREFTQGVEPDWIITRIQHSKLLE